MVNNAWRYRGGGRGNPTLLGANIHGNSLQNLFSWLASSGKSIMQQWDEGPWRYLKVHFTPFNEVLSVMGYPYEKFDLGTGNWVRHDRTPPSEPGPGNGNGDQDDILSGKVTDKLTGIGIAHATVRFIDKVTLTDQQGTYTISPVPKMSGEFEVIAQGYNAHDDVISPYPLPFVHNVELEPAGVPSPGPGPEPSPPSPEPPWWQKAVEVFTKPLAEKVLALQEYAKDLKPTWPAAFEGATEWLSMINPLQNLPPVPQPKDIINFNAWSKLITGESVFKDESGDMTEEDWLSILTNVITWATPAITAWANKLVSAGKYGKLVKAVNTADEQTAALAKAGVGPADIKLFRTTALREAAKAGTNPFSWKAVAGIVGGLTTVHSLGTFMSFIAEEMLQSSGMAIWTAMSSKQWDVAKSALNKHKQRIKQYQDIIDAWGIVSPLTRDVFQAYGDAAVAQAQHYGMLIDREGSPGLKPRVYQADALKEDLQMGRVPSTDELTHTEPLPDEPVPGLPGATRSEIISMKNRMESNMFNARSRITTYVDEPNDINKSNAVQAVADYKAAVDEFSNWVEENKEALKSYQKYESLRKDADAALTTHQGMLQDIEAVGSRGTGAIFVKSSPTGATIYVNGAPQTFPTNTTIEELTPGTYTIEIEKDGYKKPGPQETVVSEGQTITADFGVLEAVSEPTEPDVQLKGTLKVITSPTAVKVSSAQGLLGTTNDTGNLQLQLDAGTYTIALEKEGFNTSTDQVYINEGETTVLSKVLEPVEETSRKWRVSITAVDGQGNILNPKILVNDDFTGKWAPDYIILDPGTYRVSLVKTGWETWSDTLALEEIA